MTPPKHTESSWPDHQDAAGQVYALGHLDEFQQVFSDSKGKAYTLTVNFAHHCFTRKTAPEDTPDMIYQGSTPGDSRTFDPERYALSLHLRAHLQTLEKEKCFFADNGIKFFILKHAPDAEEQREYEIYFRVYRSEKGMVLSIRSAFLRDADRLGSRAKKGHTKFGVILGAALHGKKLKPPK